LLRQRPPHATAFPYTTLFRSGVQGQRPTHPELLDFLATELIASGWKLKAMHKQLMLTSTYMQSSHFDEADAKLDPENTWLWRHTDRKSTRLNSSHQIISYAVF